MKSLTKTLSLTKAFKFAAEKHALQRRKGSKAEAYIVHPGDVANLLARHTNGRDINLIIAGLLHDTVEDCGVTLEEIEKEFGKDVADLVREVSDDKNLPKEERKRLQIVNASKKSARGKMLSMADKVANLKSMLKDPPADWPQTRIAEYFVWSKKVVDNMRGVNAGLEAEFDRAYKYGVKKYMTPARSVAR